MEDITTYLQKNSNQILEELFGLLRIPSISSLSEHKDDMYRAAEYYKNALLKAGLDKAEIFDTPGHPVVYAEKILSSGFPTVLVYAHYDVMPVDPIELWESSPFEPEIREGKIYARGADDDKGQGFMHVKAIEYLINSHQLECNVKFMIEGTTRVTAYLDYVNGLYLHSAVQCSTVLINKLHQLIPETGRPYKGLEPTSGLQCMRRFPVVCWRPQDRCGLLPGRAAVENQLAYLKRSACQQEHAPCMREFFVVWCARGPQTGCKVVAPKYTRLQLK